MEEEDLDMKVHVCEQCDDLKNEMLKQMSAFQSLAFWNPNIECDVLVQTLKQVVLKFGNCPMFSAPSFPSSADSNCSDDDPASDNENYNEEEEQEEVQVDENYNMMDEENTENEPLPMTAETKHVPAANLQARKRKRFSFGSKKRRNIKRKKQRKVIQVVNQNHEDEEIENENDVDQDQYQDADPSENMNTNPDIDPAAPTNEMKVIPKPRAKVVTLVQKRAKASKVKAAQIIQKQRSKRRRSKLLEELSETLGTNDFSALEEKPKEAKASLEEIHSQIYKVDTHAWQCVHCLRVYSSRPVCTTHIRRTHLREDVVICIKCKKPYSDTFVLKKHQLVCQGPTS